jgi:hypothetical protein
MDKLTLSPPLTKGMPLWKKIKSIQSCRFAFYLLVINTFINIIYFNYTKEIFSQYIFSFTTIHLLCISILLYEFIQPYKLIKPLVLILFGLCYVVFTAANLSTLKYFNLPLESIANDLFNFDIKLKHLPSLFREYASLDIFIVPALLVIPFIIYFCSLKNSDKSASKLFVFFIPIYTILFNFMEPDRHRIIFGHLSARKHIQPIISSTPPIVLPTTILLIINESTGGFFKSAQNNALSLATRIQNIADRDSNNWLQFKYAVTNGPLTDVSLPSIMTGSGSYEGYRKIHHLPFLWNLAKARGYETAYFTSQILHWAHFDNFFRFAQIDHIFSAETWHLPLMNDFGIDDIIMAKQAAQYILHSSPDKKIFLVIFTNALHYPYQEKSSLKIPATITSRHSKATYILEETHRLIFDALVKSSRYQQSLIIVNADHGEDIFKTRNIPRGDGGQYEEILRIPFLMHFPANLSAKIKKTLRSNTQRLVSNLDIAPTLADILGLRLPNQYNYSGYSLLKKIPGNRLSICMSTNEWRRWPRMGLTLARGSDRFICMSKKSCSYYNLNIDPNEKNPIHIGSKYTTYLNEAMAIPILRYEIQEIVHG